MKTRFALAAALAATLAAPLAAGPTLPHLNKPVILGNTPQINPGVIDALRNSCVDLAVFVSHRRAGGRVILSYGVRNVSTADYVSGANQQAIVLSKQGRTVASQPIGNLPAGQTRSWSVTVAAPFEFPDTYKAYYSHDPDLYIDGNTRNDDCNRANNAGEVVVPFG